MRGISSTSREAFANTDLTKNTRMVFDVIQAAGDKGCISAQVQLALKHMPYGSITNHFKWLKDAGLIEVIGKRKSPHGRNQQIFKATRQLNAQGELFR